jgi:hypothetical protein
MAFLVTLKNEKFENDLKIVNIEDIKCFSNHPEAARKR